MKKISFDPIQNFFLLVLHYPFSELAVLQQPAPAGWGKGGSGGGKGPSFSSLPCTPYCKCCNISALL